MATIHVSENSFANKQPMHPYESDIMEYIHENKEGYFYEVCRQDERWEIFYHLSDLRRALFSWYDFERQADLLEIGGGFGALTGLFCEKCANVDTIEQRFYRAQAISERYVSCENLNIYADDFMKMEIHKKYDYVILIGILEKQFHGDKTQHRYVQFLKKAMDLLKPEGRLLAAFDNRYALKYFCGALNPYTGKPFSGLNHYEEPSEGYSWSRAELKAMFEKAGAEKHKFYYPLPDYRIPQLIYSDDCLPSQNIHERIVPYYENGDPLIAEEKELYKDIAENGVFPFFANSYLVEACKNGLFSSVTYGALTADRGKEHGFATLICKDGIVRKKALYEKGNRYLEEVYENMKDLENHKIDVVPHRMEEPGVVCMPYIPSVPLSEELSKILDRDTEEFVQIFDQLYQNCLHSSEHVQGQYNQLPKEVAEKKQEDHDLSEEDFGVILKHSYIDMVPFNCFYVNGKILYFDQEFRKDFYPAKYTLFRALLYTYYFIPKADAFVPLEAMKQKYGLSKVWDIFNRKEQEFVSENRNHQLYENFYRWAQVDKEKLFERANLLNQTRILKQYHGKVPQNAVERKKEEEQTQAELPVKEEAKPEQAKNEIYIQSSNIQRMQAVQKEMLRKLLHLCKKYHLKIYPMYGTLLGIIRHGDMIPWDDDIDVAMPREDYDKLIQVASQELKEPYYLETPDMEKNSFYGGYAKLFNCNTTALTLLNWGHACCQGIYIDIFPLDNMEEDTKKRARQLRKLRVCQRLLFAKCYGEKAEQQTGGFRDVSKKQWPYYCLAAKFFPRKFLIRCLHKNMCAANKKETPTVGILARYTKPNGYVGIERHLLNETQKMYFGDILFDVPIEAERLLRPVYGKNYELLPPENMRRPKHNAFYDFDTSYQIYFKRFFQMFQGNKNQKLVLFGAGIMSEDYMSKVGNKYIPAYYVDNNSDLWGKMKNGILIKSPQELLNETPGTYKVIICNIYYRQISKQLEQMGITDYYIYVQKKEWMIQSLDHV